MVAENGKTTQAYVTKQGRSTLQLMLYPQLCKLVMQLLVEHPTEPPTSGVLAHVVLKLISLAKQSPHIASALYNQGLVKILLVGLQKIIQTAGSNGVCGVEQRLLLDLFLLISQHAFSSQELKLFLSLFKEDGAPMVGQIEFHVMCNRLWKSALMKHGDTTLNP